MIKKTNSLLLLFALSLSLSSCAIFKNNYTPEGVKAQAMVEATEAKAHKSQSVAKTEDAPITNVKTKAVTEESCVLAGNITGEWTIVKVGKHAVERDEDMPYLNLVESDHKFYAYNGCNILNGNVSLLGANELKFDNVLATRRACHDNPYESGINKVLNDGTKVKAEITMRGQESYMTLKSTSGNVLLVLRKHNMEKLNGLWQVKRIESIEVDNPEMNLFLDIPESKVHGNTGCNYFNGEIQIDPQLESAIAFSQMAVTMRACPDSDLELAMLVALEQTTNYKFSHDQLLLLDATGKIMVELARVK